MAVMAKATQAPGLTSSADLHEWAAEVLNLRFDEVLSYAWAVTVAWNVNAVHDMRVALRRLRTALRDLDPLIDEKPLKRVRQDLKKISDKLGMVRDEDVAIIALEKMLVDIDRPEIREGLEFIISEKRARREIDHSQLLKTLAAIPLTDLRERFAIRIRDSLRQQDLFSPRSLKEVGSIVINRHLDTVSVLGPVIYEPFETERLHDLRLASKRLRYALELFGPAWDGGLDDSAAEIAKLQSFLGDVHDCDVWTETLTKKLTDKKKAKPDSRTAAAAWLLSKFVRKRAKAYSSALKLWNEWQSNSLIDRLRKVLT